MALKKLQIYQCRCGAVLDVFKGADSGFTCCGDQPISEFQTPPGQVAYAREHCSLHGLWKGQ